MLHYTLWNLNSAVIAQSAISESAVTTRRIFQKCIYSSHCLQRDCSELEFKITLIFASNYAGLKYNTYNSLSTKHNLLLYWLTF